MKRTIFLLIMLLLTVFAYGRELGRQNYTISFFDQEGDLFVDATSVTIYDAGTSTPSTVYTTKDGSTAVTNPIVSTADLADGTIIFWGDAPYYDIQIASSTYTAVVKRSYVRPTKHKIIYPTAEMVGNVSAGTITATGAVSFEGNVTLGNAVTDNIIVTGAIQGASALYFDGATNNTIETIFAFADPCTSDKTITFPDATGTVMLSTLATNAPDIANSVTGGTNQLIFEGSGVDVHETIITATNPTADIVWTLPNAGAMTVAFMSSTLATNMPEVANSVWGGTNAIYFEGGTADAYETILTCTQATTSSKTITLPNLTGTAALNNMSVVSDADGENLTIAEAGTVRMNGGAGIWNLPEASTCIGYVFRFVVGNASNMDINPDNDDKILGLTNTAGDAVRNATVGGSLTLIAVDNTNWVVLASYGTWSDID